MSTTALTIPGFVPETTREEYLRALEAKGLAGLRRLRGPLTQTQAAGLLTRAGYKTSRATWQKIEQRMRPMTMQRLGRIRKVFDLQDDEILALGRWWWR